jgi:hypothetical protein
VFNEPDPVAVGRASDAVEAGAAEKWWLPCFCRPFFEILCDYALRAVELPTPIDR